MSSVSLPFTCSVSLEVYIYNSPDGIVVDDERVPISVQVVLSDQGRRNEGGRGGICPSCLFVKGGRGGRSALLS